MRRLPLSLSLVLGLSACGGPGSCGGKPPAAAQEQLTSTASAAPMGDFRPDAALTEALGRIHFKKAKADRNLSDAVVLRDRYLVVVTDEGLQFAVTDLAGPGSALVDLYALIPTPLQATMGPAAPKEFDLEGVAVSGDRVFLTASASIKEPKDDKGTNAETISASGPDSTFSNYVFELKATGTDLPSFEFVSAWDLRTRLLADPNLAAAATKTSKHGGVDVEGLTIAGDRLYFGLRGPILANRAVLLSTNMDGSDPKLRLLAMNGLGFRSITAATKGSGYYIVAGPMTSADAPFVLYGWDGQTEAKDGIFPKELAALPGTAESGHAEAVFQWRGKTCILFDGPDGGGALCSAPGKY